MECRLWRHDQENIAGHLKDSRIFNRNCITSGLLHIRVANFVLRCSGTRRYIKEDVADVLGVNQSSENALLTSIE